MISPLHIREKIRRYRSHKTGVLERLPIVILMPHSACNCRCIMCDIWKSNHHKRSLVADDVRKLLTTLERMQTRMVLMSGGEALMNPQFFKLCGMLRNAGIKISLLSTGILLKQHAENLVAHVNDIVVSLDGPPAIHDEVRRIPGAFDKMREGIAAVKTLDPKFQITGRCVIQRINFSSWSNIIDTAKQIGLKSISFLPADVSSTAFNRNMSWEVQQTETVLPSPAEVELLAEITEELIAAHEEDINTHFVVERPAKLRQIAQHYRAVHGLDDFPFRPCNAPWVSAVIEPDGNVRPCFFHEVLGNVHEQTLDNILNGEQAKSFRNTLDMPNNETCQRCVCSLNLPAGWNG
jgi:Fe-coproporphyrin III synthase